MERLTSFIASRGLLKTCVCHNQNPLSSAAHIDADLLAAHRAGASIYVCTEALGDFASNYLPRIEVPFVLVTGDSDVPITEAMLADEVMGRIIHSDLLVAWYAQNLAVDHPKILHLPIGLDYHTMWKKPGSWGMTAISPIAQEHTLLSTLEASPAFNQRYFLGYCNWQFAMKHGDRRECYGKVDKSVCFFERHPVSRHSTWLRQSECMFVISPEGVGIDCHRTWEALLLGCIPVIKRNPLVALFEHLPVLIVDDWSEVNKSNLLSCAKAFGSRQFDFSSLFTAHWSARIAGHQNVVLPPMTGREFRKLLTRKTG